MSTPLRTWGTVNLAVDPAQRIPELLEEVALADQVELGSDTQPGSVIYPQPHHQETRIMTQALTVEIWSDLICPWCWIGKRRFERALAELPQRDYVEIVHRSFRLMPGASPRVAREVLLQRLSSAQQVTAMLDHVEGEAAKEGLTYHLVDTLTGDTLDAHRLVKHATTQGLQEQAVERFYRANFSERASLFDRTSLLRLAAEIGLEPDTCAAVLNGNTYTAEVDEDLRVARALGDNGVPFFRIAGRQTLSGAQPSSAFLTALQQAWDARPQEVASMATGEVCGSDGCIISAQTQEN
ncbi:DsbA family oxidoreductase [Pseudomonas sp. NPDC089918]|uniref:DsbA family oxidoreductase n=1 Tax=Pseudomonas sp. NPDC089918 TaxID=3390654 RepID=UPI003D08A480